MASKLTDNSKMPWGQHEGTKMANVPAQYLMWVYKNGKCCDRVRQYIDDNMDALKKEADE